MVFPFLQNLALHGGKGKLSKNGKNGRRKKNVLFFLNRCKAKLSKNGKNGKRKNKFFFFFHRCKAKLSKSEKNGKKKKIVSIFLSSCDHSAPVNFSFWPVVVRCVLSQSLGTHDRPDIHTMSGLKNTGHDLASDLCDL